VNFCPKRSIPGQLQSLCSMKSILYTVAKCGNGELVKAAQAEKGNAFFCPICNTQLLLRKSGNTGKNSKRPHFAHKTLTANCTPETALHFSFKMLLARRLQQLIDENLPLRFSWLCKYCGGQHEGNLLKKIKSLKVEHDLASCRPDIALLDKEEKVFAVIEVVVTHKPEEKVLEFYQSSNIIVIQLDLSSDNDLDELERKISKPDLVSICFNPKCDKCGNFKHITILTIVDGPCWKCSSTMKVAGIEKAGHALGPAEFSQDEIEIARSKGVNIKKQYSKTINEEYLANTCRCGAFVGEHYLFSDYIAPASYGNLPSESFEIGYHCENCFQIEDEREEEYYS